MAKQPNILLFGIDSLLATHMSCYGYYRHTTPHIDRFAEGGTLFEKTYSAHIPTTSAYASMLTGMDTFGTQVVATTCVPKVSIPVNIDAYALVVGIWAL